MLYDDYWKSLLPQLREMLEEAATGMQSSRDCHDIATRTEGSRQSWYGKVTVGDGKMLGRSQQAHTRSLGRVVAMETLPYPEIAFFFTMSKAALLTLAARRYGQGAESSDSAAGADGHEEVPFETYPGSGDEIEAFLFREREEQDEAEVETPDGQDRLTEGTFTAEVVNWLLPHVPPPFEVGLKVSLLYAITVDEQGRLHYSLDQERAPRRGGGTGFEQDILIYEKVGGGATSVVPRVIVEAKLGRVTTHDALTYADKARRIRAIYPYARYGLLLGKLPAVPPRVLRLGQEFDFIAVLAHPAPDDARAALGALLRAEIAASLNLGQILNGRRKVKSLHRQLQAG